MHRAAPNREPSRAEWRWGAGLPARLGQAPQSLLDTLAKRLGCHSALPLPAVLWWFISCVNAPESWEAGWPTDSVSGRVQTRLRFEAVG